MTGIDRQGGTPAGPPWSVDLLADLHADALDTAESVRLWPLAKADRDASAVLAALDNTRSELRGLASVTPPMPKALADRLDAAIAAEARNVFGSPTTPAPVADLAAARKRRNRLLGWGGGVLAVAAAAAAIAVVALPGSGNNNGGGGGVAGGAPSTSFGNGAGPAQALTNNDLNAGTVGATVGHSDYGPLANQSRLDSCLAANGTDPERTPLGASQVVLDGKPGTLLILPTGKTAQFRLLVVGPNCAAGHPDRLSDKTVGGVPPTPVPPGH